MKRFILILSACAITAVGYANDKNIADTNQPGNIDLLVKGLNSFAFEMYGKLNAENNLFFSPYSVSAALAMTYSGAKENTEKEMGETLNVPTASFFSCEGKVSALWPQERYHTAFGTVIKQLNEQGRKGNYELITANALWGQKGYNFLKEFIWLIEKNYQGGLNHVDFINETEAARKTINGWVEQQTRDRIKDLIPQGVLSADTGLVLTNAIYFKGKWANQFQKENTADELFYLESGKQITVAMMRQTERINYMQAEGFKAIELPYLDNELSMVIFLPDKKSNVRQFEQRLNEESFSEWLNLMSKRKVQVYLPRFTMTWQNELVPVLKLMGMEEPFSGNADFSGMSGTKDFFISNVVHKAFVEVNEEGTEAAAATGVVMTRTSIDIESPVVFRADRPFVFVIKDNFSGSVLFMGRVAEPKQ